MRCLGLADRQHFEDGSNIIISSEPTLRLISTKENSHTNLILDVLVRFSDYATYVEEIVDPLSKN